MINVSQAWKDAMQETTAFTTSAVITLTDSTVIRLTAEDFAVSYNGYTDAAGDVLSFPVGVAISRTCTLEIANYDDQYENITFYGAKIVLSLDFPAAEDSVTIGRFTVVEPETYGETVIITAQDDMYKADQPFESSLTFPTTANALFAEICTTCDIDTQLLTIPNGTYSIAEAPDSSYTYRAVLGHLAMLSGGNARINRSGYLEIINYDWTTLAAQRQAETVSATMHDLTEWSRLRTDTDDIIITGVQCMDEDGETVLVGNTGYVLALDNPLISGDEQAGLTLIGTALIGGQFRGFEGDHTAYPMAEFGDLCRITDRKGKTYYSVITDVDFQWASYTTLKATAEAPLKNQTFYVSPEMKAIQEAAKLVKQEATAREQAVQDLNDALAAAGGMYSTVETLPDSSKVYYLHDKPTLASSLNVIKITSEALGFSTDGGQTYPTGVYVNGTVIANILDTIGINADWINAGALTITDSNDAVIFTADADNHTVEMSDGTITVDADGIKVASPGYIQSGVFDGQTMVPVARLFGSLLQFYRGSEINTLSQVGLNRWDTTDDTLHLSAILNGTGVQIDYGAGYPGGTEVAYKADFTDIDPTTGEITPHNQFYGDISLNGTNLFDLIYPIGSIYMSVNSTSPATLFGGTWQQLENRFLLGAGSSYTAGATGGEATHTLTVDEMPSHAHRIAGGTPALLGGGGSLRVPVAGSGSTWTMQSSNSVSEDHTTSVGGGQAHNNMPPYLVVYMWQRTA